MFQPFQRGVEFLRVRREQVLPQLVVQPRVHELLEVVEHLVDVSAQLGEDREEHLVELLPGGRGIDVVERFVGQDFVDVDAVSDGQDGVAVVALEAVGQGGQSFSADGSVTDSAQVVSLVKKGLLWSSSVKNYSMMVFTALLIFKKSF